MLQRVKDLVFNWLQQAENDGLIWYNRLLQFDLDLKCICQSVSNAHSGNVVYKEQLLKTTPGGAIGN